MKICKRCKQEKDEAEFGKNRQGKGGLAPRCKQCRREEHHLHYLANAEKIKIANSAYRAKNMDKVRERRRKYTLSHKEQINANVRRYRESNLNICKFRVHRHKKMCQEKWMGILRKRDMLHCVHCGYDTYFEALDYHHIDPKTKEHNICALTKIPPTPERIAELDKVVCLCATCHRELHGKRWELQNVRMAANG